MAVRPGGQDLFVKKVSLIFKEMLNSTKPIRETKKKSDFQITLICDLYINVIGRYRLFHSKRFIVSTTYGSKDMILLEEL